jgi:hypothetical protein
MKHATASRIAAPGHDLEDVLLADDDNWAQDMSLHSVRRTIGSRVVRDERERGATLLLPAGEGAPC